MFKILVLVADYPNKYGEKNLMYVHVRNKYYLKMGMSVHVLNFRTSIKYNYEGIEVISLNDYNHNFENYDILICHAPNIRNHFLFLCSHHQEFKKIIFFFHGHEIVPLSKVYPKPYEYKRQNVMMYTFRKIYDSLKLEIWHTYFQKILYKSEFVFVSNSLANEFKYYLKLNDETLDGHTHVIYNSVSDVFELNNYCTNNVKHYDFITIRNNLDSSVYCIDLVYNYALKFPNLKFLIIGKGEWFNNYPILDNITWINKVLNHNQMIDYINDSKCAFMLTRRDTQGVMSCELATFGIPLITSNIGICKEVFDNFDNVVLINNNEYLNIDKISNELSENCPYKKNTKYFFKNTIKREIDLIQKSIINE